MFHMEDVGRRISELRKQNNMTQMELADRMNISFQAVSSWERGGTMPDIAKLPELALLFGVTIDELLGQRTPLLESAAKGETADYVRQNAVSAEEFAQAAPLLTPKQADEVFERADPPFSLDEVEEILPFLSKDILKRLAQKAFGEKNYRALGHVAPFVDRTLLNEMALRLEDNSEGLDEIIPFVSREIVDRLALRWYAETGIGALGELAPFISKQTLNDIAAREYEATGLKHFEEIAPFLDRGYLTELAKDAIGKHGIKAIAPVAPFLNRELLSEVVKEKYL